LKRPLTGLGAAAALGLAVLYGFAAHARHWFPYRPLRAIARRFAPASSDEARGVPASKLAERDAVGRLMQLPYLTGYKASGAGPDGVTVYESGLAANGWNLCLSAHAAEARLLDMRGAAHHRWAFEASRIWPGLEVSPRAFEHDDYWSRAELLEGGDLLVIWEYVGMARLDRGSRLKWSLQNRANHDLAVDREGRIYTLTRQVKRIPEVNPDDDVFEDFLTVVSPEGKTLRQISLLRSLEQSDYAPALAFLPREPDLLHANALQILDGALAPRNPAFREGNVLVSIRSLGLLAVLDPGQEKIVWALSGQWRAQHTPRLLDTGRLLLFDNLGRMVVGESRVVEVDAFTQEIVWRYGETKAQRLFSGSHGSTQRLANGNTLIVESNTGRALEVTPEGRSVWEYRNPYRVGKKRELIAMLSQMERLSPALSTEWADHPGSPSAPR